MLIDLKLLQGVAVRTWGNQDKPCDGPNSPCPTLPLVSLDYGLMLLRCAYGYIIWFA